MLSVLQTLRMKPVGEQARLLGNIRNFVKNDDFVNFMANYNLNDKRGDARMQIQIQSFEFVPGLKQQVLDWLRS